MLPCHKRKRQAISRHGSSQQIHEADITADVSGAPISGSCLCTKYLLSMLVRTVYARALQHLSLLDFDSCNFQDSLVHNFSSPYACRTQMEGDPINVSGIPDLVKIRSELRDLRADLRQLTADQEKHINQLFENAQIAAGSITNSFLDAIWKHLQIGY